MQPQMKPHPPIFDTADKLLRFGVSDVGEFVDSIYREQQSSKLFGKIIGRQAVTVHGKGVFTTADIVCEGYLYKKGSWMKNWKKRYFILRKDIRSLCYYASREDLTLLGAIPLDTETRLMNIKADDANGYSNVVAIETDLDDGPNRTYVRFETFEKMKAWMLDIKNEAQNMVATTDEEVDWWESLFGAADLIEPKSNASRREGHATGDHEHDDMPKPPPEPKHRAPPVAPSSAAMEKGEAPAIDSDDDTDDEGKGGSHKESSGVAEKRRSTNSNLVLVAAASKVNKKIKHMKPEKKPPGPPPFEHFLVNNYETSQGSLSGLQFSLRLCNICTYQDRLFIVIFGSNLNEKANESLAQAVQAATSGAAATASSSSAPNAPPATPNASAANKRASAAPTSGKWTQLGRTEVRMVTERPAYSESYVGDVKIFYQVLQNLIPEACKEIKIVVYRQENPEASLRSGQGNTVDGKGNFDDLTQQLEIARTVISRKVLDVKSVLKFKMKVKMQLPVDIAVPLFKDAEVTLGVLRLSSNILNQHRYWLQKTMKITPYSEILYSFVTNHGVTESLEQLVASKYGTSVGQAMISLLSAERQDFLQDRIRALKENFANVVRDLDNKARMGGGDAAAGDGSVEDKVTALYEPYRQAIESIEEVFQESNELGSIILANFDNVTQGKEVKNNVIPIDVGGGILRRSVWKKITIWQYCTTNLNLHLMLNKFISHRDVYSSIDSENSNYRGNILYTPTITLGCPAAHELGFHDGGLRRIFNDIQSTERKLVWLQAIQSPDTDLLQKLFTAAPKEALALFGTKCGTMSSHEELAFTLKRKAELARRIDICASQALGCAISVVRTICQLATISGGNHFDALARSLKTGFLVMFQSYLSTQGAEVGMLEDLEIAALWLSLVSVRLVTFPTPTTNGPTNTTGATNVTPSNSEKASSLDMTDVGEAMDRTLSTGSASSSVASGTSTPPPPPSASASPSPAAPRSFRRKYSEEGKQIFTGYGDGVTIRRDTNGRLTVDVEITAQEAAVVLDALNFMSQFPLKPTLVLPPSNTVSFAFHPNPSIHYSRGENPPRVYAVAELFGLVFTQGVNEMQTLANLSSSRDVLKQVDINQSSLGKLREYYAHYREALEFQLTKRLPEMVDALTQSAFEQFQGAGETGNPSMSGPSGLSRAPSRRKSHRPSIFPGASFMGNPTVNTGQSVGVTQADIANFTSKVEQLSLKVLNYNDRLLDQIHEAIIVSATNPYEKHVDVLLRSSAMARQICGIVGTLCKSGKDRTSMGVTLENSRCLVEDLGVHNGQEVCQLMRSQGVRRMNVYANTGQTMFAFNQIQRRALPACFRPPPGCHAGNVTS